MLGVPLLSYQFPKNNLKVKITFSKFFFGTINKHCARLLDKERIQRKAGKVVKQLRVIFQQCQRKIFTKT